MLTKIYLIWHSSYYQPKEFLDGILLIFKGDWHDLIVVRCFMDFEQSIFHLLQQTQSYRLGDLALFQVSNYFFLSFFDQKSTLSQVNYLPFHFLGLVIKQSLVISQPHRVNDSPMLEKQLQIGDGAQSAEDWHVSMLQNALTLAISHFSGFKSDETYNNFNLIT